MNISFFQLFREQECYLSLQFFDLHVCWRKEWLTCKDHILVHIRDQYSTVKNFWNFLLYRIVYKSPFTRFKKGLMSMALLSYLNFKENKSILWMNVGKYLNLITVNSKAKTLSTLNLLKYSNTFMLIWWNNLQLPYLYAS